MTKVDGESCGPRWTDLSPTKESAPNELATIRGGVPWGSGE